MTKPKEAGPTLIEPGFRTWLKYLRARLNGSAAELNRRTTEEIRRYRAGMRDDDSR